MAGANGLQNNEMLRMIQLEHLERQRRWILQQPPEKCPRCNSMETKFCYFNNYSADQPRNFCKACQRHWTKGGRLRNIPIGGSTRPGGDHVLNPQGQNPPRLVRPATSSTIPGGLMTRPGGTIPLGAVNQLHGYYVGNPQSQNPLGPVMTRSARAVTLPATVLIVRPVGTGCQNPLCHQLSPVYRWVDGFWHGPFYRTSTSPLP